MTLVSLHGLLFLYKYVTIIKLLIIKICYNSNYFFIFFVTSIQYKCRYNTIQIFSHLTQEWLDVKLICD